MALGADREPSPVAVQQLAHGLAGAGVGTAVLSWQTGRPDTCRSPLPQPPGLPLGMVVAHSVRAPDELGAQGFAVHELEPHPAGWVGFGAFPQRELARLLSVLDGG
jgi:hypothetical protein